MPAFRRLALKCGVAVVSAAAAMMVVGFSGGNDPDDRRRGRSWVVWAKEPSASSSEFWLAPSAAMPSTLITKTAGQDGQENFDYDLIVLGGGSGGIAAAKRAAQLGARVLLLDFVEPSPQGSVWGVGGTCVNVGCIPKRIFHYAAELGTAMATEAPALGWMMAQTQQQQQHRWERLRDTVQQYVQKLSASYAQQLEANGVVYYNAKARFVAPHRIGYTPIGSCTERTANGRYILIATGGRPLIPSDVVGAQQLALTSDDVFSLPRPPGARVLVVGGGYVALECASFLRAFGSAVTVAVRSQVLRGFDRECVDHLTAHLFPASETGTASSSSTLRLRTGAMPSSIMGVQQQQQQPKNTSSSRLLRVGFTDGSSEDFDAVLYATGRTPNTAALQLEKATTTSSSPIMMSSQGHVVVGHAPDTAWHVLHQDRTASKHLFAIGDVVRDAPHLTPTAVAIGEALAAHLFHPMHPQLPPFLLNTTSLDNIMAATDPLEWLAATPVPTAVFTSPMEYALEQPIRPFMPTIYFFWGGIVFSVMSKGFSFWLNFAFSIKSLETIRRFDCQKPKGVQKRKKMAIPQWLWTDGLRSCGMTEEAAVSVFGKKDVSVFTNSFVPVERAAPLLATITSSPQSVVPPPRCLCKVICLKSLNHRVVGVHFVGPNAGELIQGFAAAMRVGITKEQLDTTIGVHPTAAEGFCGGGLAAERVGGGPYQTLRPPSTGDGASLFGDGGLVGCGGGRCA